MHFEGITLAAVIAELKELEKSFIQQIYQPLPELLLLQLYLGQRHQLLISLSGSARVHLTWQKYENPSAPSAFCMLLRKHLKGGMIQGIAQQGLERLADFMVVRGGEEYTLRAELMGNFSNVILLKGTEILGALKRSAGQRKFFAGARYEPPASQGKLDPRAIAKDDLLKALQVRPEEDVTKALLRVTAGIGPRTAAEITLRAGLKLKSSISSLSASEWDALWDAVQQVFSRIALKDFQPCVYLEDGRPIDCTPFPFESYAHLEIQSYKSLSEALDAYHRERRQEPFELLTRTVGQRLKQRIRRIEKALGQVEGDLKDAKRFEEYKEQGDLLMANLAQLKKGQSQAEIEDFIRGGRRMISLDPTLDPAANAQRYYERYKKLKRAVEKLTERREDLQRELRYLHECQVYLEQAETLDELKELQKEIELEGALPIASGRGAKTPSGPRRYSVDGFAILVGRNGRQNDALIRQAHREDYWLHAKDRPGAHVLIVSDRKGVVPPERVLLRAAQLAAYYSRGRGSTKVPVTYTRVKYLKRPQGAKPGQVLVMRAEGTLIVSPKEKEEE